MRNTHLSLILSHEEIAGWNESCHVTRWDGWSNIHREPIIATCIHYPGNTTFHDACDVGSTEKNAEFCFNLAKSSIIKGKWFQLLCVIHFETYIWYWLENLYKGIEISRNLEDFNFDDLGYYIMIYLKFWSSCWSSCFLFYGSSCNIFIFKQLYYIYTYSSKSIS